MGYLTHLECALCGKEYEADKLQRMCPDCARPLLVRYDLEAARALGRDALITHEPTMWRYRSLLPVQGEEVSLGEGFTPLLHATRLGEELGLPHLYIKDESLNPTGSFKARGLAVAISRARELGAQKNGVVIPSAGNAAGAMAAYAARAGLRAHVFMPSDVPTPFRLECQALGAEITLVDGLITDCGREARRGAEEHGWFDVSTLKEPYRLEGKKTMGYELAEQFGWELPDVIIYPTGGGTGLIGMWKAFGEMAELGWIAENVHRPRMVTVQAAGCAPIPRAFHAGEEFATPWEGAQTVAAGLRVPAAVGDFLILRALRESNGAAVAVADEALVEAQMRIGRLEGVFACPEGGATLAALETLLAQDWVSPDERIVLFNTGTGLKYPGVF